MPLFEGAVTHHGDRQRAFAPLTEWLRDGKRFVCVDDANGFEQIVVDRATARRAERGHDRRHRPRHRAGRVARRTTSSRLPTTATSSAWSTWTTARSASLDRSPAHRISDLAFSPDGRFLAYVWWPAHGTSIIRIVKVRSGKVHDVTSPLRVDRSPAWDPDGKYLYFISTRDFNPVYDALQFDLSFPQA